MTSSADLPKSAPLSSQRDLEQKTLSAIARMLNSTLDLNIVLKKVVDAATSLTGAEEGLLLLPDEEGQALYIRAAKGIDHETASEFRIKTEDTLAGRVYKTGQPVLLGDAGWQKLKTAYLVRSLLYVPLSVKGQVIGVLGINNRESNRTFSPHDRRLLEDLASHAAIAIENARLYGESVTRSRELTTLVKASEVVNSTLSLESVLSIISKQVVDVLKVGCGEIMTWSEKDNTLSLLASYRQVEWSEPKAPPPFVDLQASTYKNALERHQLFTVMLEKMTGGESERVHMGSNHRGISHLMPLYANKRPLGLVELVYLDPEKALQPAELNSPTYQQQGLELILSLGPMGVDRTRSLRVARRLLQEAKADLCTLWVWNHKQQTFSARLNVGEGIWTEEHQPQIDPVKLPPLQEALKTGQPVFSPGKTGVSDEDQKTLDHYSGQAVLVLPLVISGRVLGLVVLVDTLNHRRFRKREIELAQALVLQAANALQNAWLYRDLQKSMEELRRTQSKLVQSARLSAIGELSAAVAHQINNPLTTVLGDTEMLLEDMNDGDPNAEAVRAVHHAGKRAHEVVRRLLGMARQNDSVDKPEPMEVNQTINNTLTLVARHLEHSRVRLVTSLAEELPLIYGLRGQLEDVWLNLLLNGRDAVRGQEKPMIGIRSRMAEDKKKILVEVYDNGPGISEEVRKKIFEAFFTTKDLGEGTGLGLYICKQVVENCGGDITVQNLKGKGASFTVSLPVVQEPVPEPELEKEQES
jgi:signal transduction histidine kinase